MDYLTLLQADYRRLAEVTAGRGEARVPTCPDWTADDLIAHVAMVYLHKVASMRLNAQPDPWPPTDLPDESPMGRLQRAYGELVAEFAARDPRSPAHTWFEPDQTVGFWIRRMAQETVIHRIDGELAAGAESRPIPDDLALDGIDEVLKVFLSYGSEQWLDYFSEALSHGDGSVSVAAGSHRWLVSWNKTGVTAETGDGPASARVSGTPEAILRWLWRRANGGVAVEGEEALVAQMRQLLSVATQ